MAHSPHSLQGTPADMASHHGTYVGFIQGVFAFSFGTLFILLALLNFTFSSTAPLFFGTIILLLGFGAIGVDLLKATRSWRLCLGLVLFFGLMTLFFLV